LPLYVAAAEAIFFNKEAAPIAAGYWTMDRGFDARGALGSLQESGGESGEAGEVGGKKWDTLQKQVAKVVGQFVRDIRQGNFPVASRDENCTGRCEFSTVCRIAQVRALGKTWRAEGEE
jgi:hypothetical protein